MNWLMIGGLIVMACGYLLPGFIMLTIGMIGLYR